MGKCLLLVLFLHFSSSAWAAPEAQKTLIFFDSFSAKHNQPGQLEGAWRLSELMPVIADFALRKSNYESKDFARNASIDLPSILDVHSKSYVEQLKNIKSPQAYLCSDRWCPYVTNNSYSVAARASTMTVQAARLVHEGKFPNAFVLPRPPGHHATRDRGDGFCLFNHVAIAARHLVRHLEYTRIAIVDLDVHHGNGTADIVSNDPKIRYYSVHQHPAWPMTGGTDEKKSSSIFNFPLEPGSSSAILLTKTQDRILSALDDFKPEFILVSVGYDMHWRDPLGTLQYDSRQISELHKALIEYAKSKVKGRIVFVLEGGYNREALVDGVSNTLSALQGLSLFKDQNGSHKTE